MTVDEIIDAALARGTEYSEKVPLTRSVAMRRISSRQEQLFARIADKNRDYVGRDAVLPVVAGTADTADLDPLPMRITDVLVEDAGSSAYPAGATVSVVPVDDPSGALAPRVTLRDGILAQVGVDLAGVVSLRVFYSKRPAELVAKNQVPETPSQFHELFVIDLTISAVRKMIGLVPTARKEILEVLQSEAQELLGDFDQHLLNFSYAETARFGRTARAGGG